MKDYKHMDTYGLSQNEITEILRAAPGIRYNRMECSIVARNYEQAQKMRELRDGFIRKKWAKAQA